MVQDKPDVLGTHRHNNQYVGHTLGNVCHVHGTVDQEMVFGVNDESQMAKPDVFDCENGDLYKSTVIKVQANGMFQENTDAKANQILQESHLLYIYGMSIGATDQLWWQRVCEWLEASNAHHLIVQKYGMPQKGVTQLAYRLFERKCKQEITQYAQIGTIHRENLAKQIHITGGNIFADIKDIVYKSKNRFDTIREIGTFEDAARQSMEFLDENHDELAELARSMSKE